jgi:hypothetical protein
LPLTHALGIDRSSVSRRVRVAIEQGYLRNLEDREGKPAKLVLGDPLPDDLEILPLPEALADHCTVALATEGVKGNEPPEELATDEEEAELERARAKLNGHNDQLHAAGIAQTLEDVLGQPYEPSGSAA